MPTKSIAELEEMVGQSVVTVEGLTVEAGKVEEFARALRDDNPVHRSETTATERDHHAIPAPLTFLRTAKFPS
jgi:acyl dehydratase